MGFQLVPNARNNKKKEHDGEQLLQKEIELLSDFQPLIKPDIWKEIYITQSKLKTVK